jgi:hypothetical protein
MYVCIHAQGVEIDGTRGLTGDGDERLASDSEVEQKLRKIGYDKYNEADDDKFDINEWPETVENTDKTRKKGKGASTPSQKPGKPDLQKSAPKKDGQTDGKSGEKAALPSDGSDGGIGEFWLKEGMDPDNYESSDWVGDAGLKVNGGIDWEQRAAALRFDDSNDGVDDAEGLNDEEKENMRVCVCGEVYVYVLYRRRT